MANGGEWHIHGIFDTPNENEELATIQEDWAGVMRWMNDRWSETPYIGLRIMPDAEMLERIRVELVPEGDDHEDGMV